MDPTTTTAAAPLPPGETITAEAADDPYKLCMNHIVKVGGERREFNGVIENGGIACVSFGKLK